MDDDVLDDDSVLTAREELIMQLRYGAGWPLRRIARGLGVDASCVNRAHRSALLHLAAVSTAGGQVFDLSADLPLTGVPREPVEWIPPREAWPAR